MNGVKRPGGPSGISAPGQGVRVTNKGLTMPSGGVRPQKGTPQPSTLRMRTAPWPGLPGPAQKDRARSMPEEKIYAFAQGIRGGVDDDPGEPTMDQAINPSKAKPGGTERGF